MGASGAVIVFLVLAAASASPSSVEEHFHEELLLYPLANSDVMGHLRFTTTSPASQRHFRLFPRAVAELMLGHGLRELDVSLTRGVWREQLRGYAPKPAPAGASVAALFDVNSKLGNYAMY
jgi:phosphatidylinositol glycan class T